MAANSSNKSDEAEMLNETSEDAGLPTSRDKASDETHVVDRVGQFLEVEGEKIRQETERIQSPIIAKARQDYKQRLAAFLVEERDKIKADAESEAAAIRDRAESEAGHIIARAQTERDNIRADGHRQAELMIEDAIMKGKEDAEKAIGEARREALRIIEEATQTAERLTEEAAETARKSAESEAEKIIADARSQAYEHSQNIISNSWQRAQQMLDSAEGAYKLVRTQLQGCVRSIIEADSKMEMSVSPASEGPPEGIDSEVNLLKSEALV